MAREKGGFWVGFAVPFFYSIGWLTGRPHYQGREHLPARGGALLVGNHISHLDPIHTGTYVHSAGRVPRFLAKHSLWGVPVLGAVLRGSGQIPVFRDTADAQQSLAAGTQALADGKIVIIYPEGTITRDPDGWPMRSRTGVARMALASDVPVIPMVHWGTREVLNGYEKKFRPLPRTDVVLRAGDPVDLSAYRGRPLDAQVLREVTDLIMGRVRELLAEVRDEPAPTEFYRRRPESEAGR